MQRSELRAIYKDACKAMRQDPEEAEFKMWLHVLGSFDERDLRGALNAHWEGENGKFLPKPAELKPKALSLMRIRGNAEAPEFCKESSLGLRRVLNDEGLVTVRCECSECVAARAARTARETIEKG